MNEKYYFPLDCAITFKERLLCRDDLVSFTLPFSVPHTLARKNEIHTNKNYLHHLFFIISVSVPHTFARKNEIHTNKDIFIPVVFHLIS